jgi:hypothetical protein
MVFTSGVYHGRQGRIQALHELSNGTFTTTYSVLMDCK